MQNNFDKSYAEKQMGIMHSVLCDILYILNVCVVNYVVGCLKTGSLTFSNTVNWAQYE